MSAFNKHTGSQIAILFLFLVLTFIIGFFIFFFAVLPFTGDRFAENIGRIAMTVLAAGGIMILLLTSLGALWLYSSAKRNIYTPLSAIKRAAAEIRDGNLDYGIAISGVPEFEEFCVAFESMRIRLKDSMEQIRRNDEERIAMTANICHDLKTPTTSLLGYAEGICDGVANTPEKVSEYAEIIKNKALSLQYLVNDLALLSTLDSAPPLVLEMIDISVLLSGYCKSFAAETGIRVETDIAAGLCCVIDREKILRVFQNVFENAKKYARPSQGEQLISVTATRLDDFAHIAVRDNGTGVDMKELRRIFERFYRADPSRGVAQGSGLGLSIAKQIMLLHGGNIWVQNNREGGLTCYIQCPASS